MYIHKHKERGKMIEAFKTALDIISASSEEQEEWTAEDESEYWDCERALEDARGI